MIEPSQTKPELSYWPSPDSAECLLNFQLSGKSHYRGFMVVFPGGLLSKNLFTAANREADAAIG